MLVFNPVSNLLAFLIHSRFKFFFKKLEPRTLYTILVVSVFNPFLYTILVVYCCQTKNLMIEFNKRFFNALESNIFAYPLQKSESDYQDNEWYYTQIDEKVKNESFLESNELIDYVHC